MNRKTNSLMWCSRYVDRYPNLLCGIFDLPISTSTYRCSHLSKNGGSKVVHLILILGKNRIKYICIQFELPLEDDSMDDRRFARFRELGIVRKWYHDACPVAVAVGWDEVKNTHGYQLLMACYQYYC